MFLCSSFVHHLEAHVLLEHNPLSQLNACISLYLVCVIKLLLIYQDCVMN
jgi:hypothetical protein